MAEQWLSIVEYARTFSVSDMTVRRRIKTGRLQAVLKEGKYFIPIKPSQEASEDSSTVSFEKEPVLPVTHTPSLRTSGVPMSQEVNSETDFARLGASHRVVPSHLISNIQRFENSLVDSQALLQFCEHSVTRINSIEKHLQETYLSRIQNLEAQVKLKDTTIASLKEQIEDLQMLVKLMEQNGKANKV